MAAILSPEAGWQTEWPTAPAGPPPRKRSPLALLTTLPALIVIFVAGALLMKTYLVQLFFIPSESMEPTLLVQDRVVVNKLAYRFREPRRGEVVVFIAEEGDEDLSLVERITSPFLEGLGIKPPAETDFIKRVIGLPGERIHVTERAVYITPVDGKRTRIREPYANLGPERQNHSLQEPYIVPPDMYFVMGDNRNNSSDSRTSLGPIKREDLVGKAFFRFHLQMPTLSNPLPFTRVTVMEGARYASPLGAPIAAGLVLPVAGAGVLLARARRR